jgi:proteic killer suppression protein
MIKTFKHKGLEDYFYNDNHRGINPDYRAKITRILTYLDGAINLQDIGQLPGLRLHALKGDLEGYWAVNVSGNYRIIFKFEDANVYEVNLIDYHDN